MSAASFAALNSECVAYRGDVVPFPYGDFDVFNLHKQVSLVNVTGGIRAEVARVPRLDSHYQRVGALIGFDFSRYAFWRGARDTDVNMLSAE